MKKGTLIMSLVGAGAVGLWWYFRQREAYDPTMPLSQPGNYQPAQPSLMYPWSPIVAPRVDNKNQPWYNNSREAMGGPSGDLMNTALTVQAGSSIIHSLDDIWTNMSDWFGDSSELVVADDTDWADFDMGADELPGDFYDQSGWMGEVAYA